MLSWFFLAWPGLGLKRLWRTIRISCNSLWDRCQPHVCVSFPASVTRGRRNVRMYSCVDPERCKRGRHARARGKGRERGTREGEEEGKGKREEREKAKGERGGNINGPRERPKGLMKR